MIVVDEDEMFKTGRTMLVEIRKGWRENQVIIEASVQHSSVDGDERTVVPRALILANRLRTQAVVQVLDEVWVGNAVLDFRGHGVLRGRRYARSPFTLGHVSEQFLEALLDLSALKWCHLIPSLVL